MSTRKVSLITLVLSLIAATAVIAETEKGNRKREVA